MHSNLCSLVLANKAICSRLEGHSDICGEMTFVDYTLWQQINNPGMYPFKGSNIVFPAMGLVGESGELADKIKKHWRNSSNHLNKQNEQLSRTNGDPSSWPENYPMPELQSMSATSLTNEQRESIIEEMGDVLWYLYALSNEVGTDLAEVAYINVRKLSGRLARGTTLGEGDKR
jgi:NTP pyrophosphatase (non-canonical NTP hydrolase)